MVQEEAKRVACVTSVSGGNEKGNKGVRREEGDKKRIPSLLLRAHFMFSCALAAPYPFPLPGRLLKLKEHGRMVE